jgi:hypothetical protein
MRPIGITELVLHLDGEKTCKASWSESVRAAAICGEFCRWLVMGLQNRKSGSGCKTFSVFGVRYVGAVSGACLASMEHQVVGVDANRGEIDPIKGDTLLALDRTVTN